MDQRARLRIRVTGAARSTGAGLRGVSASPRFHPRLEFELRRLQDCSFTRVVDLLSRRYHFYAHARPRVAPRPAQSNAFGHGHEFGVPSRGTTAGVSRLRDKRQTDQSSRLRNRTMTQSLLRRRLTNRTSNRRRYAMAMRANEQAHAPHIKEREGSTAERWTSGKPPSRGTARAPRRRGHRTLAGQRRGMIVVGTATCRHLRLRADREGARRPRERATVQTTAGSRRSSGGPDGSPLKGW